MTIDIQIQSHEDDSVTVHVGSITARISGDSWREANNVAHLLAEHVAGRHELASLRLRLSGMRSAVADVERSLAATEHYMRELVAYT